MCAIPAVIRWPIEVGLGLYAFLIPFDPIAVLYGQAETGPTLTRYVGYAVGYVLIASALVRKRLIPPPARIYWWAMLVLWMGLSTLWALEPNLSIEQLPTIVSQFLLFFLVNSIDLTEKEIAPLMTLVMLGGCVASALVLYTFSADISYLAAGRGSFGYAEREINPNQLGFSLLLPSGIALLGAIEAKVGWKRSTYLGLCLLITFGIFLTMSRSALVGLVTMASMFAMKRRRTKGVITAAILMTAVSVFLPETFFTRMNILTERSDAGRLLIWAAALRALPSYFAIGAGSYNFPVVYNEYVQGMNLTLDRSAHNVIISTTIELGCVGLFLLIMALRAYIRRPQSVAYFSKRSEHASSLLAMVESVCWGTLAAGLFRDIVWTKAFWLPWMLLALLHQAYKHEGIQRFSNSPKENG